MYFNPTFKAKAVLKEWHQVCVDAGSNNQPAWNKVNMHCLQLLAVTACLPFSAAVQSLKRSVSLATSALLSSGRMQQKRQTTQAKL